MNYLLYTLDNIDQNAGNEAQPGIRGRIIDCSLFSLRWIGPLLRAGGVDYLKGMVLAFWSIAAGVARPGEIRVYAFITGEGLVGHYSLVSPTSMHMPWIGSKQGGVEVGGCLTIPAARGQRLYPCVLQHIAKHRPNALPIYMIVEDKNTASRSGMVRAGFAQTEHLTRIRSGVKPPQFLIRSQDGSTD